VARWQGSGEDYVTGSFIFCIRVIKSRRVGWAGQVARMWRGACRVLVGKPEGWRPPGIPRRRREDNIKIDLPEVELVAWTGLIWMRIGTGGGLLLMW
jgi:hypothetical protein